MTDKEIRAKVVKAAQTISEYCLGTDCKNCVFYGGAQCGFAGDNYDTMLPVGWLYEKWQGKI